MPKWLNAVIGAAEIAGGILLDVYAGGAGGFGNMLIGMGIGTEINGLGTLLSKGPLQGFSTTVKSPISPWEITYGRQAVGGSLIYCAQFGDSNKWLDMVFCIADHPSLGVTGLMFDRQQVQLDTTAVATGVSSSTYPFINGGNTFSPLQRNNILIHDLARAGDIVTVTTKSGGDASGIPLLVPGDRIKVVNVPSGDGHVPGDSTANGIYPVTAVTQNLGGTTTFSYINGGVPIHVVDAGHVETLWPDHGSNIYMEVLTGDQTLGQTFFGMVNGTPDPGNIHGGSAITYNNQNAGNPPWTTDCSGVGKTLVMLRMHYDTKYFPSGIPQISFLLSGKKDIYDPRSSTTGYSENAALCIANFLTNPVWGYGMAIGSEINTAALITAANDSDDAMALAAGGTEPRYTCNGKFQLTMKRGEILQNLLTSCGGRIRESGGQIFLQVAKWHGTVTAGPSSSTITSLEWSPTGSITERFNRVKGTYIFPGNNWQSSDFPPYAQDVIHGYSSDSNLALDGDRRDLDIQLPFTISSATAQRLASVELRRRRQFGTGVIGFNMFGYQFTSLDIFQLSVAFLGWSNKELEILVCRFKPDLALSTEFSVQETDASVYDWNPSEELTPAGFAQSAVPSSQNPSVPTNLVLLSDSTTAFVDASGVAHSRILATWTPPTDGYVLSGGHIELQYQEVGDLVWQSLPSMDPNSTQAFISDVLDGHQYNVQIRSVNVAGVPSAWVVAGPVTVSGSLAGLSVFGPNGGDAYPVFQDALYPQAMFGLLPTSKAQTDGSVVAAAIASPIVPPTDFSTLVPTPTLSPAITYASTGGSIPGGTTGFIAFACLDSVPKFTKLSNAVAFSVPAGTNTNTITLTPSYDVAATLLLFYVGGSSPRALSYRRNNSVGGATVTLTSLASVHGDSSGMPDPNFDHFVSGTTKILLAGSFGGRATSTSTISAIVASSGNHYKLTLTGAAFTPSALIGRVASSVVQGTGNPTPLQDYFITANDATSVTVVAPPPGSWGGPSPSFNVGDQVVIRLKPDIYTGITIGDSLLAMTTDEFKNDVVRIFFSDGTNQTAFIASNDATTLTLQSAFGGAAPLWFWVENSSFSAMFPATPNDVQAASVDLFVPVENVAGYNAVQVFASDAFGNLSDAGNSPIRDFWCPGYSGSNGAPGYFTVPLDGSNEFVIDLVNGRNQRLVLDSTTATGIPPVTVATIPKPIFTGGTIAPGDSFSLYVDEDSAGGWPEPIFNRHKTVLNPGFESGVLGAWSTSPGPSSVTSDQTHDGAFAAQDTTSGNAIYQDVTGLIPGQQYVIEAWLLATAAGAGNLYVHDGTGSNLVTGATAAPTSWARVAVLYTANSTGTVRVHLHHNATTDPIYWDDVAVYESGGFAGDAGRQHIEGTPNTRSAYIFTWHGTTWGLDSFRTGGSIS